ncbi:hypothetical protein YC2023_087713 [Brassica napus]
MGFGLNQVNNQEKQNHSGLGEPGCDRLGGGALGNGIGGGLGNGICSGIGAGAGGGSTGGINSLMFAYVDSRGQETANHKDKAFA